MKRVTKTIQIPCTPAFKKSWERFCGKQALDKSAGDIGRVALISFMEMKK